MRRIAILLLIVIVWAVTITILTAGFGEVTVCTEDMACWDCATMGNLICGGRP